MYEGEFKSGLKCGKGKYYVNGKLIFDGEYVLGAKHGKCKEYDNNGKLIFKGEYHLGTKIDKKCFII